VKRTPAEIDVYLHEADDGTYIATPVLAADGVQDSDAKTTAAATVYITLFLTTLYGPASTLTRQISGLFFSIEAFLKAASTATADVSIKIEAKNHSSATYVTILAETTYANINTTYLSKPFTGHIRPQDNLNEWPIDIKISIKADEANEGMGKVRNTSFVTARFK
jgi:hypothetical protein